MSILKFAIALGLATLPTFAGRIVFNFSPSNLDSSLTLAGAANSAATGNSGVLSILNESNLNIFTVSGGSFSFTTGGRTTTPGTGITVLNSGGTWTITGTVSAGVQSASGVLASGTFGVTSLANALATNSLTGGIDVDFVNPILMTILGIQGWVDNTDGIVLDRPGLFDNTTGVYSNRTGGTTSGNLALQAIVADVPEPATVSMLGLVSALGALGLAARRARAARNH